MNCKARAVAVESDLHMHSIKRFCPFCVKHASVYVPSEHGITSATRSPFLMIGFDVMDVVSILFLLFSFLSAYFSKKDYNYSDYYPSYISIIFPAWITINQVVNFSFHFEILSFSLRSNNTYNLQDALVFLPYRMVFVLVY